MDGDGMCMVRGSATGPSWRLGGCHGRLVWPTWL